MSYDEYWNNTDELLVESYLKRHDFKIDAETHSNWEHINMMREALHEVATAVHASKEKDKYKFPNKPYPRTLRGQLEQERIDKINADLTHMMQMKENEKES